MRRTGKAPPPTTGTVVSIIGDLGLVAARALAFDDAGTLFVSGQTTTVAPQSLFTVDERLAMLRDVTGDLPNVRVDKFKGLLVEFCQAHQISAIVKGLRAVSDFEFEMEMAQMNYRLAEIETLFMTANPLYSFLRSSLVKEIARFGGDVSSLVPAPVLERLSARLAAP